MNLIKRNMLANLFGQGWVALMSLAFVPFYLKFIGAEGYGLVGFFVVLCTSLSILDAGLSAAAIREAAKSGDGSLIERSQVALMLRTIEVILWSIALVIGFLVAMSAPFIAKYWLTIEPDKTEGAIKGLRLMGVALTLQFPLAFYNGCLIGRQRQLAVNLIGAASATIRGVGAVLVLWFVAPTVEAFFTWQCVVISITALSLRVSLKNELLFLSKTTFFSFSSVSSIKKFAVGVGGINVLSFLLTQMDKIILSKILPIQMFGYYMLAWTLGTLGSRLVGPVFNTYYPRLTELVNSKSSADLRSTYLKASQVMGVLIAPFSIWLIFYSYPLLLIWTGNQELASSSAVALKFIVAGTMINAFVTVPYALQLAHDWTKLAFWQNFLAVLFVIPATFVLAERYGLPGAALPWLLLNACYLFISMPIMYRYFLGEVKISWYFHGVIAPVLLAAILVLTIGTVLRIGDDRLYSVIVLGVNLFLSMSLCFYFLIWRSRPRLV